MQIGPSSGLSSCVYSFASTSDTSDQCVAFRFAWISLCVKRNRSKNNDSCVKHSYLHDTAQLQNSSLSVLPFVWISGAISFTSRQQSIFAIPALNLVVRK